MRLLILCLIHRRGNHMMICSLYLILTLSGLQDVGIGGNHIMICTLYLVLTLSGLQDVGIGEEGAWKHINAGVIEEL
jgi:hypothetical protein